MHMHMQTVATTRSAKSRNYYKIIYRIFQNKQWSVSELTQYSFSIEAEWLQ